MTPTTVAAWLGGGTGLAALITALVLLVKARPENRLKNAEAAKVIQDASADWVLGVSEDLKALRASDRTLRAKVATLEQERDQRKRRDDLQERRLRKHETWDRNVAEQLRELGGSVTDPPPLYPDPTAA